MTVQDQVNNNQIHFTYKQNLDMTTLCQGDVLNKTDELKHVLKDVHPYFLNEEYKYFMVLTQSCDLVRRDGINCKTPYITLAAIRDYEDFFRRTLLLNKYAENYKGFLLVNDKRKDAVYQLIERLFNNTEPDYFFLYKEPQLSFTKSMVVYLKVSIALKSDKHYNECVNAKVLELNDEFKAKLGWLVGNIYSRVGTTDWESIKTTQQRKDMINTEVYSHCVVGNKEKIVELKKYFDDNDIEIQTIDDLNSVLNKIVIETKYDKAIRLIEEMVCSFSRLSDDEKKLIVSRIKSSAQLKQLI